MIDIQFFGGRGSRGAAGRGKAGKTSSQKAISAIDKASFKVEGNGNWQLDTPYGGGQVLRNSLPFVGNIYEARAWNSSYDMFRDVGTSTAAVRKFDNLNSAKKWIKDAVKSNYK